MIRELGRAFVLETKNTTYCFEVRESGHLEHLYYGKRIRLKEEGELAVLREKRAFAGGNTIIYDQKEPSFSLEDVRLEMSSCGKGDIREPFIEVEHDDGSVTSDFRYEDAVISEGKPEYKTLPGSYDETGRVMHLCVTGRDGQYGLVLELHYYVFEDCDVIARSAKLINESEAPVKLHRLMSTQVDFEQSGYVFTSFQGGWAREMRRTEVCVTAGKQVNASNTGTSSGRANPFVMLSERETTEDFGACFGFHLLYSGNHYEAAEVSSFGKTRIVTGINPQFFCFLVEPGEAFEAPEAAMCFSDRGYHGMSACMHRFIRTHIVRGVWRDRVRPILLNSWEASYFAINERKLLQLAKAGKEAGIELFVVDDGWFKNRNDDGSSLGDWEADEKKLPHGLAGLCKRVKELGLLFGIWVEPEMVNVNSRLYEEHPDWTLSIPGKPHSEGRNQRILDLTRTAVQDFVIEKMSEVFSSVEISYVKWDMNRIFSDYYSAGLSAERQGETAHRYVLGLYRCMKVLTERFPQILFEGCAAGGSRFDPGMLCYFPQIWASDNTDALCRAEMQNNYSYGYPLSVVGAHVSACPNHQTLRMTPQESRFAVAAFGMLGYECNFCDLKKEEKEEIREEISLYKKWREVLQFGDFYRGRSFYDGRCKTGSALFGEDGNVTEWTCVSPDQTRAVGFLMQKLAVPNSPFGYFRAKGLLPDKKYHFYNRSLTYDIREFGGLVNTVSPVHIKQDSTVHQLVARLVKLEGETEDFTAYGDALMYGGVHLKQAFAGSGYNKEVRYFPDFGTRLYFMEETEEENVVDFAPDA